MARSKNLHQVTYAFPITQPGSLLNVGGTHEGRIPSASSMLDISTQLSRALGRTIRQGSSFRVVGWGAALAPNDLEDNNPETGYGVTTRLSYIPTTRASTAAWRDLKNHYFKQSNFRKGLGVNTKFDEFEVAMYRSQVNARTSKVYVGGNNDPTPEACTLLGIYDDEDGLGDGYIAAKHLYDAKHPVPSGGRLIETDLLFDDTINYKAPKYTSYFPQTQSLLASATHSSQMFYDHDFAVDDIYSQGGVASTEIHWLPEGNHIDVLCGLMTAQAWVTAPDDENFIADGSYLYITLFIEGWSSIAKALPRKKKGGKSRGKTSRRRYKKRS
jgi:hypothetical protein